MKRPSSPLLRPTAALCLIGSTFAQAAETPSNIPLLDEVTVSAAPLDRTLFEQAQPISVLEGDALTRQLAPTLGETLSGTPGVSSSYFGPAASRPVIRGLDGDRVRVLQNGSNTLDASATSVDHAVSFDPISIDRVEVVRGPATLLFGPNAIGGVVNVMDRRIPDERLDKPVSGSFEGRYGSNNGERGGAFVLEGGVRGWQWHLEGYKRATDELHIPGFARSARLRAVAPLEPGESEADGVLPNSDLRTEGLSGGVAYVWEKGSFGLAYSGFHTNYGTVAERSVTIDMEQRRWDFRGTLLDPLPSIKSIKFSLGISDYEHTEFEGAVAGTRFENEGYDTRIEIAHQKLGPLEGVFGYQSEKSDFSALGEEAFLPPVETQTHSAFVFEEITLHPQWRLQAGARFDHLTVDADAADGFGPARGRSFNNLSGSLGIVYTPAGAYAVALNAAYTLRAPTYQELFANGPHIATNAFEIGNADLNSEKAFSLDLTVRKRTGRVTGSVGVFYYHFSDFIGQFATGETVAGEEDELPVYAYRATDARFFGGEAEVTFHLLPPGAPAAQALDLVLKADYVHAEDTRANEPLPRIPPFRASAALEYRRGGFSAGLEGQFSARQNRTAEFELPTDSYFLVNATVAYKLPLGGVDADFFVKGVNLTNEEARLHTSFLKDIAPLGGRGLLAGLKFTF